MRLLLTGKRGQVGWELERALAPLGDLTALDSRQLDLSDPDLVRSTLRQLDPDVIVNAAAYTAVDKAESEERLAFRINADAPGLIAAEAVRSGAVMVHYSTDYVFDGRKPGPYLETDASSPLGAYGRSKAAGDDAIARSGCSHLVLRTSWVYAARGKNFVLTMLRLGRERDELRIVDDQLGAPTSARQIAAVTAIILARSLERAGARYRLRASHDGVVNLTAAGSTTWFGFAQRIFALAGGRAPRLVPISTDQYPTVARRPHNSVLDRRRCLEAFGVDIPDWSTGLAQCIDELRESGRLAPTGETQAV